MKERETDEVWEKRQRLKRLIDTTKGTKGWEQENRTREDLYISSYNVIMI